MLKMNWMSANLIIAVRCKAKSSWKALGAFEASETSESFNWLACWGFTKSFTNLLNLSITTKTFGNACQLIFWKVLPHSLLYKFSNAWLASAWKPWSYAECKNLNKSTLILADDYCPLQ